MKKFTRACMKCVSGEPWTLELEVRSDSGIQIHEKIQIAPVQPIFIRREKHNKIPLFRETKWLSGKRFKALLAKECTLSYTLVPYSVRVEDEKGKMFKHGIDYYYDTVWGAFGRTHDSRIRAEDTVYVSYEYYPYRLDSIIVGADGHCRQKLGIINGATPLPPELNAAETLIGNIVFERNHERLCDDMLFPYVEDWKLPKNDHVRTEKCLKCTLDKLRRGEPVKILAWGDSVTACNFIADEKKRWVNIWVNELRHRFPSSEITIVNLGWSGKSMNAFLNEASGSIYNYREKVLESGADLVTIEFVNDSVMSNEQEFMRIYGPVGEDLKRQGMEVIAILPHPVRPDWMNIRSQKELERDPRIYVDFLRRFAEKNDFAIADVSTRFLHLWKEGIPYNSFMVNNINHPDERGIAFYAEILSSLFPEQ